MDIFTKTNLKGFFKRNKYYFIIALIIFFVALIAGAIYAYNLVGCETGMLTQAAIEASSHGNLSNSLSITWYELFIFNFSSDLIVLVGGFAVSIASIFYVALNGFSIGTMFGIDPLFAAVTVIPHGIFEFSSSIFALVGAFIITKFEIDVIRALVSKEKSVKDLVNNSGYVLKDLVLVLIFMFVLLLIAAIVESYGTNIVFNLVFNNL